MYSFEIPANSNATEEDRRHFAQMKKKYEEIKGTHDLSCDHELTAIGTKYKDSTDKVPATPYWRKHTYTEFYGPFFQHLRDKPITFLEIGVRWGGSALMWYEYFPHASLYFIDVDLKQLKVKLPNDPRVHVYEGDAYSKGTIQKLFGSIKFDIIIDDGSHIPSHQSFVLNEYRSVLKENGMILIEDFWDKAQVNQTIDGFLGKRNRLSVIDRMHCIPSTTEYILLYMN